ncbi:aspartate-semialdehyde dehydrogenase [Candidatus Woesearchaeota archaeon B3_Woes]|nr:MAG: aspartate-semialdehyde dehydrogenase [Candidatus Woesearchaeota archaeon B3_Woes]
MGKVKVGIFGATGEVGQEIINVLDKLEFPVDELYLYAGKSAGKSLKTPFGKIVVQKADTADYSSLDLALWAISGDWSKTNWEKARGSGCYVVDNSSAFRYDDNVPLIIPEINGELLREHPSRLIANPNCTTAIAAIPLHILNQMAGIERIIFSTYQSASGAGNGGRNELLEQSRNYLDGESVEHSKFQYPLPFNVIPHIDRFQENGYTKEEMKTDWESRKILGLEDSVRISSGCVRVPVERSHAEDIMVETHTPINLDEYRFALDKEPMLKVCDDPLNNIYPMPINTSGNYQVEVGRIRQPEVFDNGVRMFVCGDQLLRGAALNATLIAQQLCSLEKFD